MAPLKLSIDAGAERRTDRIPRVLSVAPVKRGMNSAAVMSADTYSTRPKRGPIEAVWKRGEKNQSKRSIPRVLSVAPLKL